MTTTAGSSELEAFARMVDASGGDPARWPQAVRARFEPLLTIDARAQRLLAEACALDRLLDAAAGERAGSAALADRILATALRDPAHASKAAGSDVGTVVPFRRDVARGQTVMGRRRSSWQAAGLLAASLLAGLYVGAGGAALGVVERVAGLAGITFEGDPVVALFGQEAAGTSDEDLL